MDDLIFDRLSSDVDTALNNPGNTVNLKGSYNYTDLNRIEQWCEYLQEKLKEYGFKEELVLKQDWNLRDFPTRAQIDRIRGNIDTLKNFCYALLTENIVYDNTMDFEKANILEKILYDINEHIKEMTSIINLPLKMGVTLVNNKYFDLIINSNAIQEKEVQMNMNVGIMIIQEKYITL